MEDYFFHQVLDTAINSNLVPYREYFLQGSILDDHVDSLLERLRGLCDDCAEPVETYEDHEMCFVIKWPPEHPLRLRVRRSLDHAEQPYLVRYVGITEAGNWSQLQTAMRTSIDVGTSSNVVEFLEHLGYHREFEFVSRGYLFKKGRMKVTVSKINKAKESELLDVLDPVTGSYFVEMSVVEPASKHTTVAAEMKQFAECLKPLVYMGKADQFRPA